ncbi:MAG: hypothetical protein ACD_43C00217G0004 [uncultured bacterium]|nr:MAG: hypothetical protein ACD_43C00217G0004 [uncultured bacterium]
MIPFNKPAVTGKELEYITQVIASGKLSGDNAFTKKCQTWLEEKFTCKNALLTTSGTSALDMAAVLADIQPGDEVIMPSYTFASTANAFVLRGAVIVFVDVRPDTMNIDERSIEAAVTKKTKAIVTVHYGGVGCAMDVIMDIAKRYNLIVIEDAAQGVLAKYKGQWLGTIGHIGCYSFHETKNYNCGEGGAALINDERFVERAEIIREKGTDRSRFFRGQVDKYTWVDIGSSYLPSELNAAFLWAQFENADTINENRLAIWQRYYNGLQNLVVSGQLTLPTIPTECEQNAHMFYIKTTNLAERSQLITHLKALDIMAVFHYIPLHSAVAGQRFGRFHGADRYTTIDSERLLRLPMYYKLPLTDVDNIITALQKFYA